MLMFEAGSLGIPFMAVRMVASVTGMILIAAVIDHSLTEEEKADIYKKNED